MTTARFLIGDVFDVMATLPDQSVDLVLTSPPFLALRSYLPEDHPDKEREIGSEPDPATFLDTLLRLTAEWGRLLAPHGSICVELGDTYAGSGGAGGDYNEGGLREGQGKFDGAARRGRVVDHDNPGPGWPLDKSLCFIPQLYGASLAYGRNLLTGEPSPAGQWRVRNVVAWCRPNPPVGALGDKFRPATSYMTIATRARDRWFDLDAVREVKERRASRDGTSVEAAPVGMTATFDYATPPNPAGSPPLDWWEVSTEPYQGSHYATWPRRLLDRPIKAMCPREVCTVCGEPRRRVGGAFTLDSYRSSTRPQTIKAVQLADAAGLTDEHIAAVRAFGTSDAGKATALNNGAGRNTDEVKALAAEAKAVLGGYFREFVMSTNAERESTWSTCDCPDPTYRPGVVLDPFGGSGTTGAVATGLGRDCILIDLDERNAELAVERIGMFCTVEDTRQAVAS